MKIEMVISIDNEKPNILLIYITIKYKLWIKLHRFLRRIIWTIDKYYLL